MSISALSDTVTVEHCDHCGCSERTLALNADPWTLMQCSDCGFVFTSPRLNDQALAKIYSEEYYENAHEYAAGQAKPPADSHHELAAEVRRLLRRRSGPLTSIDVGCGGGQLVEAFTAAGFDASGIEPSEGTVRAAQEAGRNVSVADIADLPDSAFDCVTLMHVLEHVPSPAEFTRHLMRITKPGGVCIVEVPNFGSKAAQSQGAHWYALHPNTHLSHFTPESLANCVRKAGFDVTAIRRIGGAGVFSQVSPAVKTKTPSGETSNSRSGGGRRLLRGLWNLRSAVTAFPALKRFARWVNWELLGHGEYVRVFSEKPVG